ncbi:MAG: 3'-5' exonuclease domain-containing protein 2 [Bacteroidetes bacterium]|nr:3'-5' exonuclease domain-containing protein 2 [Bacteroidota bacterium]MCL6102823.1 3'-5' exonuclease domain-containing protein 2 [Bacteroidota bacterium]
MSENNKEFKKSITDEELAALPLSFFEGKIHVIEKVEQVTDAVNYLKNQPILGFDTETRPAFKKGQNHHVALLQLSTADEAFLFRTNLIGLTPGLIKILSTPSILKIGAAIRDDIKILQRIAPFKPNGFVELQEMVKSYGIENFSLKKLAAIVQGVRISKSQRLSNWESTVLSEQQQIYAATDAWISYLIYIGLTQK